ncbi:MAG: S-layer homology domain-containing protein [Anaeromicrobium sp.]|jgi:uncharacterized protein YkwD|uniref:CAP and S-layer homology domain-containing protein n=1 Tax=Anaeromicrobium sp. TaxID=1929132 RepID=UPI0025D2752F|nr:S-layer homology domain-containing protein [Anaeromicrobium sp.]MCT4594476.1 S-layer homology domain-containing protein [Anaeromicrobium sp.]
MKKLNKTTYIFIFLLMITLFGTKAYAQGEGPGYFPPQPKDMEVLISKPQIGMQLILNGNKLVNTQMYINEVKVDAGYDDKKGGVFYVPNYPLPAGEYKVSLKVEIEGFQPITQSWKFNISHKAIGTLPTPSEEQKSVLYYANEYRKRFGLGTFHLNNSLNSAAMSHANYMALNKKITHVEYGTDPGYTGSKVVDRVASFGYPSGNVSENVTGDIKDYKEAIDGLVDAPYHRLSWLNPVYSDLGYGKKDEYQVFNFGGKSLDNDKLITYPMNNQRNVDISWNGNETPNPLRFYNNDKEVGYPITISYFTNKSIDRWKIEKVTVIDSRGGALNTYINTPAKDEYLTDSIIVMPVDHLKYDSTYTVSIKASLYFADETSKNINKSWNFSTRKKPQIPKTESVYKDVTDHWARPYIEELVKRNIVTPKTGDYFKPDYKITRAEFTQFIVKALKIQLSDYGGIFNDVPNRSDKAKYIEAAHRAGIINGTGNGMFEPDRTITREEIATIITKTYEKIKSPVNTKRVLLPFYDNKKISDWAQEYVKSAFYLRIITGRDNGHFDPQGATTKAESAVMIKKLLDVLGR